MTVAWSYSSISLFKQCARKYYHLKVAKDVQDTGSEAMIYGQDAHKAAEEYIKHGIAVPEKFKIIEPVVASLNKIPGDKHCEVKLGLTKEYDPCGFFDKGVWWRGIADLLIVNGDKAYSVDFKTGKSGKYADMKQLDLVAGAIFAHFPTVKKVKSALAFVISGEFLTKEHRSDEQEIYLSVFDKELEQLDGAMLSGVFNAKPSGLCGYCPVRQCEHHRER
jgi:hypothetical protein